jgi:enediyne biosynthesis protein E4
MTAQVDGGSGHSGKRSPDLHFGLGHIPSDTALPVTIRWRDLAGIHEEHRTFRPGWHTEDLTSAD